MDEARRRDAIGERSRQRLTRGLQATCATGLLAVLVLSLRFAWDVHTREVETRAGLLRITQQGATEIERILRPVSSAAGALAAKLTRGEVAGDAVEPALKAMIDSSEIFLGGGVAYRTGANDEGRRLYSPYYLRHAPPGMSQLTQLGDVYDYPRPASGPDSTTDWYVQPMRDGGSNGWSPPYFDPALSTTKITFSAIFMGGGPTLEKNGVVTVDVSLDRLGQVIRSLRLGPDSFGALTTADGVYIYHPDGRLVREQKTLTQVAAERNEAVYSILAQAAADRASGVLSRRSTTTDQWSWLAYASMPDTGWSLQISFARKDVPRQVDGLICQLVWITIALTIMLTSGALLLRTYEGRTASNGARTAAAFLLVSLTNGALWWLVLNFRAIAGG